MRFTTAPKGITPTPLSPAFGVLVQDVDLDRITPDQFRRLYQLWQRHHVLVLRDQQLTAAGFHRLGAMLGDHEHVSVGDNATTTEWHSDKPWLERPPFAALLWAEEVPERSGAMWFASMPAALRSMPQELVARLNVLPLQHGPGAIHPMVIMQPETGESSLYLGRRKDTCIPGVPQPESDRLLNILWSYATATSVSLCHQWQQGDVVLWNNLTTIHRVEPLAGAGGDTKVHVAHVKGRYTLSAPIQQEAA